MTYELLVRIIEQNGNVESFSMSADQERLDGCKECARICPGGCSCWCVGGNVWCVVYVHGVNNEI